MKRFYKAATVNEGDTGFAVMLDGRAVKTVSGRAQRVPTPGSPDASHAWALGALEGTRAECFDEAAATCR